MQHPTAVPTAQLKAAPWNPRDVDDDRLADLCQSMREDPDFLWCRPILAQEDGTIYAGVMRWLAATAIGLASVPAIVEDVSDQLAKQRSLRDNAHWGKWVEPDLARLLRELDEEGVDLAHLGFEDTALQGLLDAGNESALDDEDPSDLPAEPVTQPGDTVYCGPHAILCGDARNKEDVARLMGEERAAAMVTDPPYGVGYEGKTDEQLTITNDQPSGLAALLYDSFQAVGPFLTPGAAIYLFHPAGKLQRTFLNAFAAQGWDFRQTLVWVKDTFALGHSDYHYQHEPILYGRTPGGGRRGRGAAGWYGGNDVSSVFTAPKPHASRDHPTMKPVEILRQMITHSTRSHEIVLDPFLGSGSTLIAADEAGRVCYGIEIDPRYVDVAVQRWERATGETAQRERPAPVAAAAGDGSE